MRMSLREGMNANILKCTYDVVVVVGSSDGSFLSCTALLSLKRLLCSLSGGRRGRSLNLLSLVEVLGENLKYALTGEDSVRDFP